MRSSDRRYAARLPPCDAGNDHGAALHQHVADEQRPRVRVPERQVIRRMPRRVQHGQRTVVGVDDRTVLEPGPRRHRGSRIGHGNFVKRAAGQRCVDRRRAGHVIAVRVRDEDERRAVRRGVGDRVEMRRVADAGIDQHRMPIANQVGPVAVAGHRTRIGRVQKLRLHVGAARIAGRARRLVPQARRTTPQTRSASAPRRSSTAWSCRRRHTDIRPTPARRRGPGSPATTPGRGCRPDRRDRPAATPSTSTTGC